MRDGSADIPAIGSGTFRIRRAGDLVTMMSLIGNVRTALPLHAGDGIVMINIRHLRAFVAVAEHLHFTRAAASLCVTQPALSALIRQMEAALEAQLIQRSSRRVALTDIGMEFYQRSRSVLAAFDSAVRDIRNSRPAPRTYPQHRAEHA